MKTLRSLARAKRGAAAVEFALITPPLVLMLIGILQLGILYGANAGLEHAVAEGARFATISPSPSNDAIEERVTDKEFALRSDRLIGPTVSRGVADGTNYVDVSMSYDVPLDFVLFEGPTIRLTETRRAYTP